MDLVPVEPLQVKVAVAQIFAVQVSAIASIIGLPVAVRILRMMA